MTMDPNDPINQAIQQALAGGGGAQGAVSPEVYARYVDGKATRDDLVAMMSAGEITPEQARSYEAKQTMAPLVGTMTKLGLHPYDPTTGLVSPYSFDSPIGSMAVEGKMGREGRLRTAPLYDPGTGALHDSAGERLPQYLQPGSGPGGDPYAGAANARAERALQEQIRAQRIQEAMAAIENLRARALATQEATMAGLPYQIPGGMEYFPGASPTSPAVQLGIMDPVRTVPTPFNPRAVANDMGNEALIRQELARVRAVAGA